MPDNKVAGGPGLLHVSKGVAKGHILCCCAVVFVCFMLTCLNLYMLSSTRSVLRHLDARLDAHPRNLQAPQDAAATAAAMILQQQQQQQVQQQLQQLQQLQPQEADDFILLAPTDLDNAWTTQTGRLLVPVGQPEEGDDGWKQMQVQLAEQTSAQQRHIESLHDKLADQYRAREELHRDQQNLMREQQQMSLEHQQALAKRERQLLKEKHRSIKQGVKHKDELRRVQSEVEDLKRVVEAVKSLDPEQQPAVETAPASAEPPTVQPVVNNEAVILQLDASPVSADTSSSSQNNPTTEQGAEVAVSALPEDLSSSPLDHIFSAVFGPSPGAYFFPSYSVAAERKEEVSPSSSSPTRKRRDLNGFRKRALARKAHLESRLGSRRRRHDQESGVLMRIEDGQMVPLYDTPAVVMKDEQGAFRAARRRRG